VSRAVPPDDLHEWLSFEDPDEKRTWVFDVTFLLSRWTCIYGRGCQGVLTEPAPELAQGCCSYGAHFTDDDDRARVEAAAAELTREQWQHAAVGRRKGIAVQERGGSWRTRVHDGACVMLNRPGFAGGIGCALHRAALDAGERPLDRKPEVCWQLPVRRVDTTDDDGHVTSTVREWKRRDWGDGGQEFHWWCTDTPDAFVGEHTVLRSMEDELREMVGSGTYDRLVDALAERRPGVALPHPAVRSRSSPQRQQRR
jgi:hypothetical protein